MIQVLHDVLEFERHGRKPGKNDERTTSVGGLFGCTSLDELPQFLNFLSAEMSLVGPRPEQLPFQAHDTVWQRQKLAVKPGMTGWWQVNGRKQPMHVYNDEGIFYMEHHSIWLDMIIIWRTLWAALGGKGAK